jgi:glutathione S-transferase
MPLQIVIGSKNYSSWSLRPWLALAHHNVTFEEIFIPLDQPETREHILRHSPAGKVPILIDGVAKIWESIAILVYLGDKFPEFGLWPKDAEARAHALSISSEMHAGFVNLRRACPMNLRRKQKIALTAEVKADVQRITKMWNEARKKYGKGGDFLFGGFSAADCMYAPVATRIRSYEIPVDKVSAAYVDAIYALPAFRKWYDAAMTEPWRHAATDAVE